MSESDWITKEISKLTEKYDAVPPPWVKFPNTHPYSIGWRMGDGESYMMVWHDWWDGRSMDEERAVAYFRKWPPPPRWLAWMIDKIWDLKPWDEPEEFDYSPYFKKIESLGFGTQEEYERDLDDPKWLT